MAACEERMALDQKSPSAVPSTADDGANAAAVEDCNGKSFIFFLKQKKTVGQARTDGDGYYIEYRKLAQSKPL